MNDRKKQASECQEGICTHALQDTMDCNITIPEDDRDIPVTPPEPRPHCRVRVQNVTPEVVDNDDYNLAYMPYVIVYGRKVKDFRAGNDRKKFMADKYPRYYEAIRESVGPNLNDGKLPDIFNNLYDHSHFVNFGCFNPFSSSEDSDVPAEVNIDRNITVNETITPNFSFTAD